MTMQLRRLRAALTLAMVFVLGGVSVQARAQASGAEDAPDPTIAKQGEWYYVFSTGRGTPVRRSRDLVHWERVGQVFDRPVPAWAQQLIPGAGALWAPEITFFDGKYYLYYSVSTLGSQRSATGLATATTLDPADPDAGWTDQGLVLQSAPDQTDYNAIDAGLVADEEGRPWLVWGSYWSGIKLAQADPQTGKLRPDAKVYDLADNKADRGAVEGAIITRRDGWFYLFLSHSGGKTYNVRVGRSRTIFGPYVDREGKPTLGGGGTLLLSSYESDAPHIGPGHNGLLVGNDDGPDVMVHHVHNEKSRDMEVRPVYWADDGWPLVGEPLREPWPEKASDEAALRERLTSTPWTLQIAFGDQAEFRFEKDGRLRHLEQPGFRARWTLEGRELTVRAPAAGGGGGGGGESVAQLVLAPDGRSAVGRTDAGVDFRGWPAAE